MAKMFICEECKSFKIKPYNAKTGDYPNTCKKYKIGLKDGSFACDHVNPLEGYDGGPLIIEKVDHGRIKDSEAFE